MAEISQEERNCAVKRPEEKMLQIVSSLSAGDCLHLQRVTIPEAAYIQLQRRPPEDEQGNARNM
jgi:hypothetical protein